MLSTLQQPDTTVELDLKTIRQRVSAIKRNWTPDQVRERANEGRQRRKQLEVLIRALESTHGKSEYTLVC